MCNGAVISGRFGGTRADAAARATLPRLLPGRVVERLHSDHLGAGGGGIHCVTQQQPAPQPPGRLLPADRAGPRVVSGRR
ncbi:agmatine deiminase family protein [Streptomyces xanthophaeus]|uniref:agmatine deiminase family protein n=1 Tax=Streptomyces xanthophaeus TaxID=67385 RepID=UPI00343E4CDC